MNDLLLIKSFALLCFQFCCCLWYSIRINCRLTFWYFLIWIFFIVMLDFKLKCLFKLWLKLWLALGVFLMATSLRMYATCQQMQAQAQAHAAAASGLLGHTELRLHVPPSIAFAPRGRLQGLRLQLALLDREFDDLGICFLVCLICLQRVWFCSLWHHGWYLPPFRLWYFESTRLW